MSAEKIKPSSIFIPIDWGDAAKEFCRPKDIDDIIRKYLWEEKTEDAEFEIIQPKQIDNGKEATNQATEK